MPVPVIFDTDIGSDIDDTWALGFLLRCPELDVRLITTDRGRPAYRAKLCCQVLEAGGRQISRPRCPPLTLLDTDSDCKYRVIL